MFFKKKDEIIYLQFFLFAWSQSSFYVSTNLPLPCIPLKGYAVLGCKSHVMDICIVCRHSQLSKVQKQVNTILVSKPLLCTHQIVCKLGILKLKQQVKRLRVYFYNAAYTVRDYQLLILHGVRLQYQNFLIREMVSGHLPSTLGHRFRFCLSCSEA